MKMLSAHVETCKHVSMRDSEPGLAGALCYQAGSTVIPLSLIKRRSVCQCDTACKRIRNMEAKVCVCVLDWMVYYSPRRGQWNDESESERD